MPRRLISLLLVFVLGLQAVVLIPANAHASAQYITQDHCDGTDHNAMHSAGDMAGGTDKCPCCPDTGMSPLGCVSTCAIAMAIIPGALSFSTSLSSDYEASVQHPLSSRFDIPPTPPPIA